MKKFRVFGNVDVVVSKEVWANTEEEAMEKAHLKLPCLTAYCGNGGYDKLIGVSAHDESVDVVEDIEYDDVEVLENDPDYFEFSDEDMLDIISSATYDISYWGGVNNDTDEWDDVRKEIPDGTFEDRMYYLLESGHAVEMFDVEDPDEVWQLTLDKLLNGIKLAIQNGYWTGNIDDIDGEVGDIIFQYALFDSIVYG